MRNRYAKTWCAALIVLLGALPLTAEGKADAGTTKPAPEKIELRFGWWGDDSRHKAYIAAINRYMELHPNVKIIAEYGGWDGYKEKLYTQLAGGNAPQIFQNHYTWLDEQSQWKGKAVIKDLYAYKDLLDMTIFPAGFVDEYTVRKGTLLALPSSLNSDAILGNKALLNKAGIDYTKPWTFEDFFTATKKIKALNPDCFFENGMSSKDIHMYWFLAFLVQKTGLPYTTDYKLSYDRASLIEAFTFIKRYFGEGVVEPLGTLELYAGNHAQNPKWIKGESAIHFGMLSTLESGVKSMGDFANQAVVLPLPIMAGAKNPYFQMKVGQIFSVAATATDEEAREAAKFLNWTITDKEAASLLALSRGIPISETQKRVLSDEGKLSPLIIQAEKYARTAGQGLGQDPLIRNNEIMRIGADVISRVAFDMITPEKAADMYRELINKKLAELKANVK